MRRQRLTLSAGKSVTRTLCLWREAEVAVLQLLLRELNGRLKYGSEVVPRESPPCAAAPVVTAVAVVASTAAG